MNKLIHTWTERFDATFKQCLVVYSLLLGANLLAAFKSEQGEFGSMREFYEEQYLTVFFLFALLAIVLVHVLFLQRYYTHRPMLKRMLLLPQPSRNFIISEFMTIFLSLIGLAVVQGICFVLCFYRIMPATNWEFMLTQGYETPLMLMLFAGGYSTFEVYFAFFSIAEIILLFSMSIYRYSFFTKVLLIGFIVVFFGFTAFLSERLRVISFAYLFIACGADIFSLAVDRKDVAL